MPDEHFEEIVRTAVMSAIIQAFPVGDRYAAVRHLASAEFQSWASGQRNALIIRTRAEHPGETYIETAERLGTSVATVNRAVTAHNRRTAQPDPER